MKKISDVAMIMWGAILFDVLLFSVVLPRINFDNKYKASPKDQAPAVSPAQQPIQVNPSVVIGELQVAQSTSDTPTKN